MTIWNSTRDTTLFNLSVCAWPIGILKISARYSKEVKELGVYSGILLVDSGLVALVAYRAADLAVMYVMPNATIPNHAVAMMEYLPLNIGVYSLLAFVPLAAGGTLQIVTARIRKSELERGS